MSIGAPSFGNDAGQWALVPAFVGDADDGGFEDVGVIDEGVL